MVIAFDRYFTSVKFSDKTMYATVGTALLTIKDMPKNFLEKKKMSRGEAEFPAKSTNGKSETER